MVLLESKDIWDTKGRQFRGSRPFNTVLQEDPVHGSMAYWHAATIRMSQLYNSLTGYKPTLFAVLHHVSNCTTGYSTHALSMRKWQ